MPVLLSPSEERRFHDRVARELIARLKWAFLIAAALFLGFTAFDYLLDPARYGRNVNVRLITVALFALLHALSRLPGTARWSREFFLVGVAVGGASVTRLSIGMAHGELLSVGSLLLMVVVIAALSPRTPNAAAGYALLVGLVNLVAVLLDATPFYFFVVNVFVVSGSAAGAVLAWVSERHARRSFRLELDLEVLATRDSLTGIHNRGSFLHLAEAELARAERTGRPVALLLMDIDRFKTVNDTWGHPAGDAVIRALAATCQDMLRAMDHVGRLGGEEFAVLLPESDAAAAQQAAERLREAVEHASVDSEKGPIRFTISLGVAVWSGNESLGRLLSRGDEALYAAKREGRNRVCSSPARAA